METFLQTILSFPTIPLTVLLGITVCYWIFALVTGAVFDGGAEGAADAAAAGLKGAGDAVAGAVKGAGDAVAGAVKGAGDAVVGAVKGAGDAVAGAVKGAGDAAAHAATHAGNTVADAEGGFLTLLGVGRIPVTVTMSAATLLSWTICSLASSTFAPAMLLTKIAVLLGSMLAGLVLAALVLSPIGRAIDPQKARKRRDSLGQICTITSGKVDAGFGTAHVDDGGAGLNVHVVCNKANQLKKGDRALIVDYDHEKDVYDVEPIDWLLPQEIEALNDPSRAAHILSTRRRH